GVACLRVAGQVVVVQQPRRVVVLVARAAAVRLPRPAVGAGIGPVRGGGGVAVVVGVPEQAAVVRRPVPGRAVQVDVDDVPGQRVENLHPVAVPRPQELHDAPEEDVVLVVVVRDDRRHALVVGGLVVGVHLAVVTPAVFVDDLTAGNEAAFRVHHFRQQRIEGAVRV